MTKDFGYSVKDNYAGVIVNHDTTDSSASVISTVFGFIWKLFNTAFNYIKGLFGTLVSKIKGA